MPVRFGLTGGAGRSGNAVGALAMLALLAAGNAQADGWNGSIVAASDNVYRGVSLSDGRPALLVDLSGHTDTGWSASLGWSTPAYRTIGGTAELTVALSKSWRLDADWQLQASATQHRFYGSSNARTYSHNDFGVSLDWQGRWQVSASVSPDYSDFVEGRGSRTGTVLNVEGGLHQRLVDRLAFDAGMGYSDERRVDGGSYLYASVGLSWGIGPMLAYLTFIDSRVQSRDVTFETHAKPRWVGALMWSF